MLKGKGAGTGLGRKKTFACIAAVLLVLAIITCVNLQNRKSVTSNTVTSSSVGRIGQGYFNLTYARTDAERQKGLSGKDGINYTDAMVFVFNESSQHCFWMKDMKFNIDIMWFDQNKKLVYVKKDVSPSTYPQSFCPDVPTMYVAEVTAGVTDNNQIKNGDFLEL